MLARPQAWDARLADGVVRLRSADRSVIVSIAATAPSRTPARVLADTQRALERDGSRLVARRSGRLAGRSAQTASMRGRSGRDALVLAAGSRWRTYAVTVFTARSLPAGRAKRRAAEARDVLASLTFVRPEG